MGMDTQFTPDATAFWQKIPEWAKEQVLTNVWCRQCGGVTTIVDFNGEVIQGDLVLTGTCKKCGSSVRRLIEKAEVSFQPVVRFVVQGLPPKKDGANSMWRKPAEVPRLKALRLAAFAALQGSPVWETKPLSLRVRIAASIHDGDLDTFITGICDGLMSAHGNSPVIQESWLDVPEAIRPHLAIVFRDDRWISQIIAQRIEPIDGNRFYEVEIEPLENS